MNFSNSMTLSEWKLVLIPITILLYTMVAPSQGQSVPNTNRSVYIEGMETFTIMANPSIGHATNSVINLNSMYNLVSHQEGPDTYTTIWTDQKNRVIEHKGVGGFSFVSIQAKKSDGTYGTMMRNRSTTNNITIATALRSPSNWLWVDGYTALGGNSNVNLTNMFVTQATPKERAAAKGLSEQLNFINGRWSPQ